MIRPKPSPPSLRRRLMLNMLLPAVALAAALGVGGWLMIGNVVEAAHDRLLDGSVLAIAERLTVDEDNEVTVDLPPVALGMLESQAHDSIYYNHIRRHPSDQLPGSAAAGFDATGGRGDDPLGRCLPRQSDTHCGSAPACVRQA